MARALGGLGTALEAELIAAATLHAIAAARALNPHLTPPAAAETILEELPLSALRVLFALARSHAVARPTTGETVRFEAQRASERARSLGFEGGGG